jgi:penicillin-binding protein 1C
MLARAIAFIRRIPPKRALLAVPVAGVALAAWIRLGPIPADLLDSSGGTSTVVVDRNGVPLYEALSGEGTRSVALSPDAIPPVLAAATLAAEDRRFRSHPGVDLVAIVRALKHNLAEGAIVEGGSTITQQVAKLLLNRRDPRRHRGVGAKVTEAVLALRLEHRVSKPDILAMYLNLAGYGNQIAGAERASRAYFGVPASMLTPAQAAFLAGLPQRPSTFNPFRNRAAATTRQRTILRRMQAAGSLSEAQAEEARSEQLRFASADAPFVARHFVEMVLDNAGSQKPARIETTLDARLQADITGIIRSQRRSLDRHGARHVAVVVLDNARGEWLAWEGSGDYFGGRGGAIDGARSPRQPGSALKPFTYAAAFEEGLTPASVLPDVPSHFPTAEPGAVYSPRNYDGRYRGPLLARRALAGSENVPAVALASDLGVPKLLRFLNRAGFSSFDRTASYYGLGLTLGNAEVRLDELVAAYASFARGGEWVQPTYLLDRAPAPADRARHIVMGRRTAFWITDILSDPRAREYVFGRGGSLEFPFPVAVKTGTSQAYHDNWTVGYTREVTVGVWVGNFDRTPLRNSSGVTGAAPLFQAAMLAANARATGQQDGSAQGWIVAPPADVAEHDICALSGLAANDWCPTRLREWLPAGDRSVPCSWHHIADEGLVVFWPAQYRQWAKQNGLLADAWRYPDRPFLAKAANADAPGLPARHVALDITNPPAGAVYLIDPTLRRDFQTLPLRVVASRPGRISWSVNSQPVGVSNSDGALLWPLTPGSHRITARDEQGRSADTTIVVR